MDEEHYFRIFHKFLPRTNEHLRAIEWVHSHADELELRNVRTVLSIGAGSGSLDLEILSCFPLLEKFVVVEPSPLMIAAFKQELQRKQQEHKQSDGMLKDRNLEELFVFECCKFEEITIGRLAELLPRYWDTTKTFDIGMKQALFDLAIMSHCLYYMDPEAAVLRTGLIARKLLIFHGTENGTVKIINKFTARDSEKLISSSNILDILQKLASRPRAQMSHTDTPNAPNSTVARSSCMNHEKAMTDRVHLNPIQVWQLPFTLNVKNVDDDTVDFLLHKTAEPDEREQMRQFLLREYPDRFFLGSSNVLVVAFDGE